MKKIIFFLLVIIALIMMVAFMTHTQNKQKTTSNPYNKKNLHSSTMAQLDDPNYQNLILPEELKEDLKNKEEKTVYFYSPECANCKKTTLIVAPLAEKMGIDLVQYNLLEFKQGWKDYHIKSMPTIIYFKNGVEKARTVGYKESDAFRKWFEKNKIN